MVQYAHNVATRTGRNPLIGATLQGWSAGLARLQAKVERGIGRRYPLAALGGEASGMDPVIKSRGDGL